MSTPDPILTETTMHSLGKLDDSELVALNTAINDVGDCVLPSNPSYEKLLQWKLIDITGTATDLPSLCDACVAEVISRIPA